MSQTNNTKTEQNSYKVKYNYRIIDGYAVPLYFSHITKNDDLEEGKTFSISNEALFSDIRPVTDSTEFAGEKASGKNSFNFQGLTYDKVFWDNYTVIE